MESQMTNQTPKPELFLQIGRKRYAVVDFQQASQMFETARDAAMQRGLSPDEIGREAFIVNATGKKAARISWNGRVWPAGKWTPTQQPLYDNRTA
jgi:hypothetical protein